MKVHTFKIQTILFLRLNLKMNYMESFCLKFFIITFFQMIFNHILPF